MYKTIISPNLHDLAELVTAEMANGFNPVGGITVIRDYELTSDDPDLADVLRKAGIPKRTVYVQPVFKV